MRVYETIHGWPTDPEGWLVIGRDGKKELAFQRADQSIPPQEITTAGLQLDILVDDVEEADGSSSH